MVGETETIECKVEEKKVIKTFHNYSFSNLGLEKNWEFRIEHIVFTYPEGERTESSLDERLNLYSNLNFNDGIWRNGNEKRIRSKGGHSPVLITYQKFSEDNKKFILETLSPKARDLFEWGLRYFEDNFK